MSRLPLPVPDADTERRLAHLAQALASADGPADRMPEYIELQSMAAMLYGLGAPEFEHVLSTFPLVDPDVRTRCLQRFSVPEVIVPR
jgi:hypothetical protein